MKHVKKFNEKYLTGYSSQPIAIDQAFENALSSISVLESSLEKSEFDPGIYDPQKGIEAQRTKEEFIQAIEDIAQELNSLKQEYIGALGRGGSMNVVGKNGVSQTRSY